MNLPIENASAGTKTQTNVLGCMDRCVHCKALVSIFVPAEAFSAVHGGMIRRPAINFCERDGVQVYSASSLHII